MDNYSDLENHICWKDPREANMLPPIQTLHKVTNNHHEIEDTHIKYS